MTVAQDVMAIIMSFVIAGMQAINLPKEGRKRGEKLQKGLWAKLQTW